MKKSQEDVEMKEAESVENKNGKKSNNTNNNNNNNNEKLKIAQAAFKDKLTRYYKQITKGCDDSQCKSICCSSNPGLARYQFLKANKGELVKTIVPFAQSKQDYFCKNNTTNNNNTNGMDFLDLTSLKSLIEECTEKKEFVLLVRKFGYVFGSAENLSYSFLKHPVKLKWENHGHQKVLVDSGVDLEQVREAYKLILNLPENVIGVMNGSLSRLLNGYKRYANKCDTLDSVRALFIVLEHPQLFDLSLNKDILRPLLNTIINLPFKTRSLIIKQWKALSKEGFKSFVHKLQNSIALRIESVDGNFSLNQDMFVSSATVILSYFYDINEEKGYLDFEEFYNGVLNNNMDLKEDFTNWKRKIGFSFCLYPFILNPETKSKILHIESLIEQRKQREETLQMLAMGIETLPVCLFRIDRQNLILSSLYEIGRHPPEDLKKELKIKFIGEDGVDEGGVKKEWFQLVVRNIFNVNYGMFLENKETRSHWFNPISTDLDEFKLIGTILGLAIYNGVILDVHFPLLVYKKLAGYSIGLDDLYQINPGLHKGLKQLLSFDGDVESTFELTFEITYEYYDGAKRRYELKPNGSKIPVTNSNREDYVRLYTKYLLEDSIEKQWLAFYKGFKTVCDTDAFQMFKPRELELLVCGSPVLDFEALEKSTLYDGYTPDDATIKFFWNVVHEMSFEQKKRLLFFTTGSDRSPIGGLQKLNFVITKNGEDDTRLPSAHTCFNHLLLPAYTTKEKLEENLLKAIVNSEGFGLQ